MPRKRHQWSSDLPRISAVKWAYTRTAELAFWTVMKIFTEALMQQHLDPAHHIILHTVPSGFWITCMVNRYNCFGILRLLDCAWRKYSHAKHNYDMYNQELLAILGTVRKWWHYLEGDNHKILIQCDHKNLEYFQMSTVLSQRQVRWVRILWSDDLVNQHMEGKNNPADRPSRRPDNAEGYKDLPHDSVQLWRLPPLSNSMFS